MEIRKYLRYRKFIKAYVGMEGFKVKWINHNSPSHVCKKCSGVHNMIKHQAPFYSGAASLVFYSAMCNICKIAYVHENMKEENI